MRLRKLMMKAFGPFKNEVVIDFHKENIESGLLLITGETGAGKTSIFDAVCYALYGRASGNTREKNSLRSDFVSDDVDTVVTLGFEHNGHDYEITRSIRMTKRAKEQKQLESVSFEINGRKLTGKTEVDNAVKELLSLDYSQFAQVAMLAQGEFSRFLLASPDDKKIIFRKIFNSDVYNNIMRRLKDEARVLNGMRESAKSVLEAAKNKLEDIDTTDKTDAQLIEVIEKKIAEDGKKVNENLKKRDELGEKKDKLTVEHDRQSTVNQRITELKDTEKNLNKLREDNKNIEEDRRQLEYNRTAGMDITAALKAVSDLDTSITDSMNRLSDAEKKLQETNEKLQQKQQEFQGIETYSEDHKKLLEDRQNLENTQKKLSDYSRLEKDLDKDRKLLNEQITVYENALSVLLGMEKKFYLGQACMLADQLKEGEPCPVCGSVHHPAPASGSAENVTQQQLDKQRSKTNEAEKGKTRYETRITEKLEQQKKLGIDPDTDIDAEISQTKQAVSAMQKTIKELEDNYNKLTKLKSDLEKDIAGCNATIKNLNESIIKQNQTKEERLKRLEELYVRYGTTREEYEKRLIDRETLRKLENRIAQYDKTSRKLNAQKETLSKLVEGKSYVDLTEMKNQLDEISKQWEQADKLYSRTSSKLNTLKGSLKDITEYSREYQRIDSQYVVAQELSSIANGSHAGTQRIDFENYVLSYYLNSVLNQANIRLMRMTDNRYSLARKESADKISESLGLRFTVYDGVTNKERDVGSLSGGEKFKAALALALGLSDVISMYAGGIKLDCLFVDEGFGSLDSNSLDQALNTLSELSDGDKLVAIISHVPELENRIDRQIVVNRTNNGSYIQIKA